MKIFVSLLYFLIFVIWQSTAMAQNVCGSTNSCGDHANSLGVSLLFSAAAVGPHLLTGNPIKRAITIGSIGFGNRGAKELSFDIKSQLQNELLMVTSASISVFDSSLPSVARYGLGAGYSIKVLEHLFVIPEFKFSVEKYDVSRTVDLGSQARILAIGELSDRDRLLVAVSHSQYSYRVTRMELGYIRHLAKYNLLFPEFTLGPMVSFEHNELLDENLTLFSIIFGSK